MLAHTIITEYWRWLWFEIQQIVSHEK